jgi:hypothetical protein
LVLLRQPGHHDLACDATPLEVLPLAVALPRVLEEIEAELAAGPTETGRLRERAELIRGLLSWAPITSPAST